VPSRIRNGVYQYSFRFSVRSRVSNHLVRLHSYGDYRMNIIQFGHARHRVFSSEELIEMGYSPNTRLGQIFRYCVACNVYTYGTWWQRDNPDKDYVVCRQCNKASEKVLTNGNQK
jgi:hypothetical protein